MLLLQFKVLYCASKKVCCRNIETSVLKTWCDTSTKIFLILHKQKLTETFAEEKNQITFPPKKIQELQRNGNACFLS